MDESRARALLRAERAEVATLLRETEESESEAEQAPDSPTDFGDEGLALTEEEDEGDVADQLIPAERLEADPAAELTVDEARAQR
jgi:RNA polymerase-binding transcription factor DksA